jgi:flagellar export protein FliJ
MKKFQWSLQTLLKVTCRRDQVLRGQVASLNARIARTERQRDEIVERVRATLDRIASLGPAERMSAQRLFLAFADTERGRIEACTRQIEQLRGEREQAVEALAAVRRRRETLEQLREQALQEWRRQADRLEQKQLDENATMTYARAREYPRLAR